MPGGAVGAARISTLREFEGDIVVPYEVLETPRFSGWLSGLRDRDGRARIARRVERMRRGNFGDHRSVGGGVSELRIDCGPGYRVYYALRGEVCVILLCGGDKSSQGRDIEDAKILAGEI